MSSSALPRENHLIVHTGRSGINHLEPLGRFRARGLESHSLVGMILSLPGENNCSLNKGAINLAQISKRD
jgi:hypothetical protein